MFPEALPAYMLLPTRAGLQHGQLAPGQGAEVTEPEDALSSDRTVLSLLVLSTVGLQGF